ncbi:glycosyltransferase family 4 protein [Paenibacillus aquistagni]|uniref:glycosyltransferase family 4 protein n=1 Tax=Paenibacillus aquistagni TaxID=1852522 RepID=UPI000B4FE2CE|nr:glycosyltransferase family 4 protein [Paenibacillus aquistagni]
MNILFTFYVPSGGMETLNRQRCMALRRVGIQGHLLYTQQGAGVQNISNIPTYITNYDEDIAALLRSHHYAAIVVSSDYTMLERLRRLGYQGPIIYEAQGLGTKEAAERYMQEAAAMLKQHAQAVHLPSTPHLIALFRQYCPSLPQYVFHNVVDIEHFHYKRGPLPPVPILAWIGRLEPNKNWKHCLEIAYYIRRIKPPIELWMFHDDQIYIKEDQIHFYDMIQHLGLASCMVLRSNVPHADMSSLLSAVGDSGGFLLSTSIMEGFGYAVAEAMSCRCPVLSTDSEGVRVFISHNVTGKFYPQGNIQAAVHEGLELMSEHDLRASIRSQGVEHIKKNFSAQQYGRAFKRMLHELHVL